MAGNKAEKATITVDRDGLVRLLYDEFKSAAACYKSSGVSIGECISRAFYLFVEESCGEGQMKARVEGLKRYAKKKGLPFNENVVLDTKDWEKYLYDRHLQAHKERLEGHRKLDNV